MPFKSESQRRYLWMHHPKIAKKWAHEHPESNKGLPKHKSKVYKKAYSEEKARLVKNRKKSG